MLAAPFIQKLSETVGQEVNLDEKGAVAFSLAGGHVFLEWNDARASFVAYAEVGPLLGWNDAEVCRELLSANFLLLETLGSALSYDEVNYIVALNRNIAVQGLDPDSFINILNEFLLVADIWKEKLILIMAQHEELARSNAESLRELSGEMIEEAEESAFLLRV